MHFLIFYQSYSSQRVLKGVTTVPLLYFERNIKCYFAFNCFIVEQLKSNLYYNRFFNL